MSLDGYWRHLDRALDQVRDEGSTVDDVIRILLSYFGPSSTEAFCADGGDRSLAGVLFTERYDWSIVWCDADYYWCGKDSAGNLLSYIEGDVERGNAKSRKETA